MDGETIRIQCSFREPHSNLFPSNFATWHSHYTHIHTPSHIPTPTSTVMRVLRCAACRHQLIVHIPICQSRAWAKLRTGRVPIHNTLTFLLVWSVLSSYYKLCEDTHLHKPLCLFTHIHHTTTCGLLLYVPLLLSRWPWHRTQLPMGAQTLSSASTAGLRFKIESRR